uniref:OTU domain-containing protein n=1 Tax=viral metagenome TaxID=1070528 RepID=A0A6C0BSE5_9ZZZZ
MTINIIMVLSRINRGIDYTTNTSVNPSDIGHESSIYDIVINDTETEIVLGKLDDTFLSNYGVVFYNVYDVLDDAVGKKIGIYELLYKDIGDVTDEDGDIDLNKLDDIILFNIPAIGDGTSDIEIPKPPVPYKKTPGEPWIQSFMKNKDYDIIDNEGGGDCLFSSIRDALELSGITISVKELRKKISDNAKDYVYMNYKVLYDSTVSEYRQLETTIAGLKKEIASLRRKMVKTVDGNGDTATKELLRMKQDELKSVNSEMVIQTQQLNEFLFMKDVDSLEKFKLVVKTSNYWGDAWAISSLEQLLQLKLVLLNKRAYIQKSTESVLSCGENPSTDTIYSPKYYILLNYTGQHYTLVTYKGMGSFTFVQLPNEIKHLVMKTCLEKMAGTYYTIKEFRDMMDSKSIGLPSEIPHVTLDDTYDEGDIFQYYIRSMDARPGKGNGEKLGSYKENPYRRLGAISHWRRTLSNSYIHPFQLDNHTWNSVTHYLNANKFKKHDNKFYLQFAIDVNPDGELSNDPYVAESAGTLSGKYKGKQVRPIEIKIDPLFSDNRSDILYKALMAKFSSSSNLRDTLKLTLRAKLHEYIPRNPPLVSEELMNVRKNI